MSLWKQAYDQLLAQNPSLVQMYWKILADSDDLEDKDVQEQLSTTVQQKRETMEKKQWKFVVWYREITVRDQIDEIVKAF